MLENVFLRLYAFNMGRRFRSRPDQACNDAVMQLSTALVVPLGLVAACVVQFIPGANDLVRTKAAPVWILVALLVWPLVVWIGRRFDHYRAMPAAADRFSSPRERLTTIIGLVLIPLLLLAAFGCATLFFR